MPDKIMSILAEVTGGKSYKAHKYGLDHADRPFIDYGEDSIIWKKTAETNKSNRKYVPLGELSKKLSTREEQLLSYFLDGSRRVFKVDDIAYTKSGGRSVIYPVVAGQIGVGCCKRENKRMFPIKFKGEFVLSIPDIANADGKAGFFPTTARKLNESAELKKLVKVLIFLKRLLGIIWRNITRFYGCRKLLLYTGENMTKILENGLLKNTRHVLRKIVIWQTNGGTNFVRFRMKN